MKDYVDPRPLGLTAWTAYPPSEPAPFERIESSGGAAAAGSAGGKAIRHLKSELVLCHQDAKPLTHSAVEAALPRAVHERGVPRYVERELRAYLG